MLPQYVPQYARPIIPDVAVSGRNAALPNRPRGFGSRRCRPAAGAAGRRRGDRQYNLSHGATPRASGWVTEPAG